MPILLDDVGVCCFDAFDAFFGGYVMPILIGRISSKDDALLAAAFAFGAAGLVTAVVEVVFVFVEP